MSQFQRIETIIENDKMVLWYHPDEKIVHHKMKKFIYGKDFQQLLLKGLDIFITNRCSKWLSDDQNNILLPQEDIEWGNKYWKPKILEAGWKYWAIVTPVDIFSLITRNTLIKMYKEEGVTVTSHTNVEEAYSWLVSVHT